MKTCLLTRQLSAVLTDTHAVLEQGDFLMLPGMWVGACVLLQCGVCGGSGPCPDEVLEAHAHPCSCGDEVWWARVPGSSGPDGLSPTEREGSSDSDLWDPTQDLTWVQTLGVRKEKD